MIPDPGMDYNLAMGLHLASVNELNEDADYIFGGGSADSWYVKQIKDKLENNPEVAQQFGSKKISTLRAERQCHHGSSWNPSFISVCVKNRTPHPTMPISADERTAVDEVSPCSVNTHLVLPCPPAWP